ncbi:MAG: helix-turn-helix domain-containing protein [Alphaproteobacteria bacterium]|nr:helix-turn-helix domain-containing protein [Alphaproteobacteria bacterium]
MGKYGQTGNQEIEHASDLMVRYLKRLGLTEQELARRCNVSQGWVNKIKNGRITKVTPRVFSLLRFLAEAERQEKEHAAFCLADIHRACEEVWDGSPSHAREIIEVLKAFSTVISINR